MDVDIDDWDPQSDLQKRFQSSHGVLDKIGDMVFGSLNDANKLEDVLKKKHGDIETLLIEPILGNCCSISATQEYMQAVRSLCDQYDVILIIDEVKTGFRVAKAVFKNFGIEADLCTFAKSIANGYPISAICGKIDALN